MGRDLNRGDIIAENFFSVAISRYLMDSLKSNEKICRITVCQVKESRSLLLLLLLLCNHN